MYIDSDYLYICTYVYVRGMIKNISFRLKKEHYILHTKDNNNKCYQKYTENVIEDLFKMYKKVPEVHLKI